MRASTRKTFAGFHVDELRVAAERFRIPPRELQEALPQQVLMLLAADAALSDVTSPEEARPRTGVFIGLDLDLNTTNYHFRWWVLKHADEWAERLGLHPSSPEFATWKRALLDAAHPALNANRVMGALGSIAASRIARAFHLGGPSFTVSDGESSGLHALAAAAGRCAAANSTRPWSGPSIWPATCAAPQSETIAGRSEKGRRPSSSSGSTTPCATATRSTRWSGTTIRRPSNCSPTPHRTSAEPGRRRPWQRW